MTRHDFAGYALRVAAILVLVAAILGTILDDSPGTGCRPDQSVRCYR